MDFSGKLKRCKEIIEKLEKISEIIGPVASPSMILTGLGHLRLTYPYQGDHWWYDADQNCLGYKNFDGQLIKDPDFAEFDQIRQRAEVLYHRHIGGPYGVRDPGFEMIRDFFYRKQK